ncbi:DedA family protein [Ligilactobacillus hayakitensis DSM 18933 = JCM 14209]|uniref:DedA family protein n=1 Tax=Ligilactobacillus hayakitensis DSM 18933 = JCM 14209 TaxID=1423755 RepID=A0A0R1WMW5_9LACO|nr:VTT domain-containing protein [Ligilactobacillus hayakitensis]KRM19258.1 DedA family protein [Ligilactobacillus hayakitensis DSM 18933 = JCM 14209]
MSFLIDFILHIDAHLENIVNTFGNWTYLIVFSIIFIETGAVIMPFLPGDSLLFAASALAASPKYHLNIWYFIIIFFIASVVGDSLNFYLGKTAGKAMTNHSFFGRFIKEENIKKTEAFFEKHGGIAIALARFMPIIRTLSPFVCGGSGVKYSSFIKYNLIGATAWVAICCGGGFFFGNIPFVKEHFSMVILGIIGVSLLPAIIGAIKSKLSK